MEKICIKCDNGKGHKMIKIDDYWVCPNCNIMCGKGKQRGVITLKK